MITKYVLLICLQALTRLHAQLDPPRINSSSISTSATSPSAGACLPGARLKNPGLCLQHIADLLNDENAFYFGRNLDHVCDNTQQNNPDNVNCFIDDEQSRRYSIASRLFPGGLKTDTIDRFLDVTFSTNKGVVNNACGAIYPFEERITDINPDMLPTQPIYVRNMPKLEMRSDQKTFYTIFVVDVIYGYIHGFFKDYPMTVEKIHYKAPLNFRNLTNVFAFVVYRQPDQDYLIEPRMMTLMENPGANVHLVSLEHFASEHSLIGPIAINWMLVERDPWAVQQVATNQTDANYCITLIQEALRLSDIPSYTGIPQVYSTVDAYLEFTFASSAVSVTVCCKTSILLSRAVALKSPLGDLPVNASQLRAQPAVTVQKSLLDQTNNVRKYCLLMGQIDMASSQSPFIPLWLVGNVDANSLVDKQTFSSDQTFIPYTEPFLLSTDVQQTRRIYFFLFEENALIPLTKASLLSAQLANCSTGKCHMSLEAFIRNNTLTLRGVSWLDMVDDLYSTSRRVLSGANEEKACSAHLHNWPCDKLSEKPTVRIASVNENDVANMIDTTSQRTATGGQLNLTFNRRFIVFFVTSLLFYFWNL